MYFYSFIGYILCTVYFVLCCTYGVVQLLGVDLSSLIGLLPPQKGEAVVGVGPVLHLDAFKWVERDSYLPQVLQLNN